MRLSFILISVVISSFNSLAHAQVFRCLDAAGKVTYSDKACDASNSGGKIEVRPNTLDTSGSREQAARREQAAQREEAAQRESSFTAPPTPEGWQGDSQWSRAQIERRQERCRKLANDARYPRERRSIVNLCASQVDDATFDKCLSMMKATQTPSQRDDALSLCLGIPAHSTASSSMPTSPQPGPRTIVNCDQSGCWDNFGGRYNKGAANTFFPAAGGGACQMMGGLMHCP